MTFKYVFFKYISIICLCVNQVLAEFGITNFNILDNYYDDASNFMNNQPLINGITLILPQEIDENPVSQIEWPAFRPTPHLPHFHPQNTQPLDKDFVPVYPSKKKPSKRRRKQHRNNRNKSKNKNFNRPKSLYDSSPPNAIQNEFDFLEPIIKVSDAKSQMSDSPNRVNPSPKSFKVKKPNYKRKKRPKKFRTATANQISHKTKEEQKKINDNPLESDDPNHYPHQYAIEIRWKNKNNELYDSDAPSGDEGVREMHSSKDFEHSKYRLYEHKEEEHWHEKKWLKEGLKKGYVDGKEVPMHIVRPSLRIETNAHYNPLPIYAQTMPDGSTLEEINEHFAIPTKSFRVNSRFIKWAEDAIDLSKPDPNFKPTLG